MHYTYAENGHKCPRCGQRSQWEAENGSGDADGTCQNCLVDHYERMAYRDTED